MPSKYTLYTRKTLFFTAKRKGIKEPHKMPTEDLIDAINRYNSKRKSYRINRKLSKVGLNKYI